MWDRKYSVQLYISNCYWRPDLRLCHRKLLNWFFFLSNDFNLYIRYILQWFDNRKLLDKCKAQLFRFFSFCFPWYKSLNTWLLAQPNINYYTYSAFNMLPNVFRILLMICLYRNGKVEQKIDFLEKIGRKKDRIKKEQRKLQFWIMLVKVIYFHR